MVNFKDGELVKDAYVIIDGKEYEVHMPEYSGETPLSAEILNKMQVELMKLVFPVGSTYITQDDTNPSEILKFGTWERLKGKVCLGLDEDDEDFNVIGKKGGEKYHTLTLNEMPKHIWHSGENVGGVNIEISSGKGYGVHTQGNNLGQSHNNLQPYEVVGYMWIRRA